MARKRYRYIILRSTGTLQTRADTLSLAIMTVHIKSMEVDNEMHVSTRPRTHPGILLETVGRVKSRFSVDPIMYELGAGVCHYITLYQLEPFGPRYPRIATAETDSHVYVDLRSIESLECLPRLGHQTIRFPPDPIFSMVAR